MSNAARKKRGAFSVKSHVEGRAVAGRGVGAVQLPEGVKFYKFSKKGPVRIDILQYKTSRPELHSHSDNGLWYEMTYFIHRNVGIDNASVLCPKATLKKPCPICEYRNSLDRNDEEDKKKIKALYPQERQLFNVVVHEDGKLSDVMVLDQSRFGFGKIIDDMVLGADEEDDHYQYYPDLKDGSTLKINVDELKGGDFTYFGAASIEFKERRVSYDSSWLERTIDLDSILCEVSYEELRDMFFGVGSHDPAKQQQDDDDDDELPAKPQKSQTKSSSDVSKSEKSSPKRGVVDDFEDDDDDDDEPPAKPKKKPPIDDDEDDDEPPTKPKVPAKSAEPKKRVPVEDWDDEDD